MTVAVCALCGADVPAEHADYLAPFLLDECGADGLRTLMDLADEDAACLACAAPFLADDHDAGECREGCVRCAEEARRG